MIEMNDFPQPVKTYAMVGSFTLSIILVVLQKVMTFNIDTTWLVNIVVVSLLGIAAYFYQQREKDTRDGLKSVVLSLERLNDKLDSEVKERLECEIKYEERFAKLSIVHNNNNGHDLHQINNTLNELIKSQEMIIKQLKTA